MTKKNSFAVVILCLFLGSCVSSDFDKGMICLRLGDYRRAAGHFDKVLEKKPADCKARIGLGKALLQKSIDNQQDSLAWREAVMNLEAAEALKCAGEISGLLSQVWAERAGKLLKEKDTLQCLQALTRAIEYDPASAEPLNMAGIIYFRMGRIEKSRAILKRAAAIDTANPAACFNLGMIDWYEGNIESAHKEWLKALKCAPDDQEIIYWFARSEKRLREASSQ
ncbi:MAG TPA: tetratricopeptide repeat protein [Chitinispirillaceae bacterium]|jgi:Flp pilus assembly protein TadD|nr:tetratricopeptide repeat protein [Chitinispirillaceae bacterium]